MGTVVAEIRIDQRVSSFVSQPRKMLIGGRWIEAASRKTFPTYQPRAIFWPRWLKVIGRILIVP